MKHMDETHPWPLGKLDDLIDHLKARLRHQLAKKKPPRAARSLGNGPPSEAGAAPGDIAKALACTLFVGRRSLRASNRFKDKETNKQN